MEILKYKGQYIVATKIGKTKHLTISPVAKHNIKEVHYENLLVGKDVPKIMNNRDFITRLNRIRRSQISKQYILLFAEDRLIALSGSKGYYNVDFNYYYDPLTYLILIRMFGTDRAVTLSYENNFELLGDCKILNIILKCNDLVSNNGSVYNSFDKKCSNGKVRKLYKPDDYILDDLKSLNRDLQRMYENKNRTIQTAYKRGSSILDNARPHKNNRYVFKADIENFFPSCKRELVKEVFRPFTANLKDENVIDIFLDYMLVDDGLCLGNPLSPTISNEIISKVSRSLARFFKSNGCMFTQYSDDLTVSSDKPLAKGFVIDAITNCLKYHQLDTYFKIKESKSIGQVGDKRNITGIAFDSTKNNLLTTKRSIYREIRVSIHKLHIGDFEPTPKYINVLKGKIAFSIMVGRGDRILSYLQKYPDINNKYELISERQIRRIKRRKSRRKE